MYNNTNYMQLILSIDWFPNHQFPSIGYPGTVTVHGLHMFNLTDCACNTLLTDNILKHLYCPLKCFTVLTFEPQSLNLQSLKEI